MGFMNGACVCVYVCACACVRTCVCECVHACVSAYVCLFLCVCLYVTCVIAFKRACVCAWVWYVCVQICMYVSVCACFGTLREGCGVEVGVDRAYQRGIFRACVHRSKKALHRPCFRPTYYSVTIRLIIWITVDTDLATVKCPPLNM